MKFEIGDKVVYSNGRIGEITDRMYSDGMKKYYYEVEFPDNGSEESGLYEEDDLQKYGDVVEYVHEIEYHENLVVAKLYEIKDGNKKFIAKGHGHIFHDGAYGVAQAASYALKRICEDLGGGTLKSYKNN